MNKYIWILLLALTTAAQANTLEIHFIDVGQGDSTLVVCPDDTKILVDAGSTSGADGEIVRDYILGLIDPDTPRVDSLIITHADQDHYNLIPFVLDGVDIGHIYHVGANHHYSNANFRAWLNGFAADEKTKFGSNDFDPESEPSDDITCGAAEAYVLAADVRSNTSWKNARSIVLMIRYGEFEVILTGDATFATEDEILSRYDTDWLNSDVLKLGHHGSSATSTDNDWAEAVRPEVAVASAGWHSQHGHPRRSVVRTVDDYTISWEAHSFSQSSGSKPNYLWHDSSTYREAIFNTASNGTVVIATEGDGSYSISWFDYGE